jgi:ribosomal protein S27AE
MKVKLDDAKLQQLYDKTLGDVECPNCGDPSFGENAETSVYGEYDAECENCGASLTLETQEVVVGVTGDTYTLPEEHLFSEATDTCTKCGTSAADAAQGERCTEEG